jgi:RNA polymerase sigma-70 factor (ECF subfamily)
VEHGYDADGAPVDLDEFVRVHTPAVRAVVRLQLHNREDVDEVAQEAFARAIERLDSLQDPSKARPWLLAIARNAAIDRRRADRHRAPMSVDDLVVELSDSGPGPDWLSEIHELLALVESCAGRLSPRDATLLDLVGRMGFSVSEAAGVLAITPGAAKVALHRARRRLIDALVTEAVLVRPAAFCPSFHDTYERDGLEPAILHALDCAACIRRAEGSALAIALHARR